MGGFHRTFATGAACQQRTRTPPDTLFCPTFGLASVLMSRPISPKFVLFPDFWVSNIPRYFFFALHINILRSCWSLSRPIGLMWNTRQTASILPPPWICKCGFGGTVNSAFVFTCVVDDFNFHITNLPFLSSNIPYLPAYDVLFLFQNPSDTCQGVLR